MWYGGGNKNIFGVLWRILTCNWKSLRFMESQFSTSFSVYFRNMKPLLRSAIKKWQSRGSLRSLEKLPILPPKTHLKNPKGWNVDLNGPSRWPMWPSLSFLLSYSALFIWEAWRFQENILFLFYFQIFKLWGWPKYLLIDFRINTSEVWPTSPPSWTAPTTD